MSVKIKAVRAPDIYAIQKRMLAAIGQAWEDWGTRVSEKSMKIAVSQWTEKPDYYHKSAVKPGRWTYRQYHRSQTVGGQRYNWVRNGTGLHGARHMAYPIYPKTPGGVLRFGTPHSPKSLAPGQSRPSGPRTVVFTTKVDRPGVTHPGIKPRNATKNFPHWVRDRYVKNTRRALSLLRVTQAAARRSFRRR